MTRAMTRAITCALTPLRSRTRARRSRAAGFTLLELLLAVAVSTITASVLYAGLAIAFNARQAVTHELDVAGTGRTALEVVRGDLIGAARPRGELAGPFVGDDGLDDHGRPAHELRLVTNNRLLPADEPMGELFAVRLGLVDAPDITIDDAAAPGRWLVREVRTNLLATRDAEPAVQVLARRVWSLEMRYHDGDDWQQTWDSTGEGDALPVAVELSLRLLPEGVDAAASLFELDQQAIEVRRVFPVLKGVRNGAREGAMR